MIQNSRLVSPTTPTNILTISFLSFYLHVSDENFAVVLIRGSSIRHFLILWLPSRFSLWSFLPPEYDSLFYRLIGCLYLVHPKLLAYLVRHLVLTMQNCLILFKYFFFTIFLLFFWWLHSLILSHSPSSSILCCYSFHYSFSFQSSLWPYWFVFKFGDIFLAVLSLPLNHWRHS